MTIKSQIVLVLALSAVVCGCVAHRPPRVGQEVTGDPSKNYLPFKTAEVPDEKEDEGQAPDFRNPISRSKCEELMKAGKYGIRRAESWDELPIFKALMENDEGWCFVDDEYPRIRVNRCQLVEDWFQFWIEVGRYSPLLRAAPISDNCRSRNSSDDDPDTDRGWKRKRQKAFHKGLEAMKIYYSTSSYDYSGRFTYTREDDISLTTDLQEIPLLMEYLKKELADMKFPRYYRVQKVEFVGKRPGDAPQK